MAGLSRIIARWIGRQVSERAGTAERKFVTFSNYDPLPVNISFQEKIKDLAKDRGLTEPYISGLIKEAKTNKSLFPIKKYLESSRNDLPYNLTKKLLAQIAKKLDALKQQFAEVVDPHEIGGWFL